MTKKDNEVVDVPTVEQAHNAEFARQIGALIGTMQFYMHKANEGALQAITNMRARELGITPEELIAIESPKSKGGGSRADMQRIRATREACEQVNRAIAGGEHLDAQGKLTKEEYDQLVAAAMSGETPHQKALGDGWKKVDKLRNKYRGRRPDFIG